MISEARLHCSCRTPNGIVFLLLLLQLPHSQWHRSKVKLLPLVLLSRALRITCMTTRCVASATPLALIGRSHLRALWPQSRAVSPQSRVIIMAQAQSEADVGVIPKAMAMGFTIGRPKCSALAILHGTFNTNKGGTLDSACTFVHFKQGIQIKHMYYRSFMY